MARSEARLQFSMWRDGLDGLTPHAKLVYVVLLTEPTVNHAGVGAVREALWARNAGLSMEECRDALVELTEGRYLLIDHATEEVLVRTLIRNDGVAQQPYVLKGALKEALHTASPAIRAALASELRKLPPKQPDGTSKSGRPVVYPDPHAVADQLDPSGPTPAVSEPSRKSVETLSEGFQDGSKTLGGRGGGRGGGISSSEGGSVGRAAQTRGTRIPEDFAPTTELVSWVRDRCPDVNGKLETERFVNHFLAKAGREAIKVDWVRTWKNWMLEEQKRSEQRRPTHLRAVAGGRPMAHGYDEHGQLRDPKTGVLIER